MVSFHRLQNGADAVRRNSPIVLLILGCALLVGAAADQFRVRAQAHYAATQRYEDVYYLPPPSYLVSFSLGYREVLADLVWMKALIYFGEEIVHRGDAGNLYRYTDAMLTLDERFKKVYHWVAITAIYRPGEVGPSDVYKAIDYLKRGFKLFPDDGELAWDLGATYSFELPPLLKSAEERRQARAEGIGYLELASLRGAGPAWLGLQAASQLDRLGKTEQALRHLEQVYATTTDENTRTQIEAKITRMRSAAYAEAFKRANQELAEARLKHFPYMDDTLYLMVGPRPPFDGTALRVSNFDPLRTHHAQAD